MLKKISKYDKKINEAIEKENKRQENSLNLIASENYTSLKVMKAQGSILTNKYAEGYPNNRYYSGCKYIDIIEKIAIKRAKKLFKSDFANVQPHSGSQANFAVYMALLKPGDTILGMNLKHGGHLTHGSSINFSGKIYKTINYGVDKNGKINYKEIEEKSEKYKPKMVICGFSAYSGIINWLKFRKISDKINAYLLADISHVAGLVSSGMYPNPINYAHVVTTTTHKTLAGPRGGLILAKHGNKSFYKKINSSVFPVTQGGPLMHVIAGKAISFKEAMEANFKNYQKQIIKNAKIMANVFYKNNFTLVSKEINNHLFLIDLRNKNITGKEAENILNSVNITINKNSIPNDTKNSIITSGIRIGTAAITRRGLKEKESIKLANWICEILNNKNDKKIKEKIKNKVLIMCKKFPIYI